MHILVFGCCCCNININVEIETPAVIQSWEHTNDCIEIGAQHGWMVKADSTDA